jgi:hypothetical protein
MKLSDKVKLALEETRILILGAQILLGVGFRGVFAQRFDQLPPNTRYLDRHRGRDGGCPIGPRALVRSGAQALFGVQLVIVLMESFELLPAASKIVHAASLFLVARAVMPLMAPAPYHRIVYAGEDMYRVGSALVTAATLPLGLGLAGDIYVVIGKIWGFSAAGLLASGLALLLLIGFWYLYPLVGATRCSK